MITTIPFSGFYESMHSQEMEREIEQMVSDSSGCHPVSDRIANDIWDGIEWGDAMRAYAKEFAEQVAYLLKGEYGIVLEYESMSSPREYNFTTDRVFCTISEEDARKLLTKVRAELLRDAARERFTSRSGFISYYSPDVESWGDVAEWDHNQLGTLVAAAMAQFLSEDWEWSIVENMSSNGEVSRCVDAGLNEQGQRLARIASYLREREERAYRHAS